MAPIAPKSDTPSPDPATLDAPACLAEIERLYGQLMALGGADAYGPRSKRRRGQAAHDRLVSQIAALSQRYRALTTV